MKGVTAAHSAQSKPQPPKGPMFFNRLDPIFRTGGEKPATVAQKRGKGCLVQTNEEDQYFFHLQDII